MNSDKQINLRVKAKLAKPQTVGELPLVKKRVIYSYLQNISLVKRVVFQETYYDNIFVLLVNR